MKRQRANHGRAQLVRPVVLKTRSEAPGLRRIAYRLPGLEKRRARFQEDADAARKLVALGATKPDPNLDVPELAAYTVTANVLLNLDEVVTRE